MDNWTIFWVFSTKLPDLYILLVPRPYKLLISLCASSNHNHFFLTFILKSLCFHSKTPPDFLKDFLRSVGLPRKKRPYFLWVSFSLNTHSFFCPFELVGGGNHAAFGPVPCLIRPVRTSYAIYTVYSAQCFLSWTRESFWCERFWAFLLRFCFFFMYISTQISPKGDQIAEALRSIPLP